MLTCIAWMLYKITYCRRHGLYVHRYMWPGIRSTVINMEKTLRILTCEETSDLVAQLYNSEFNGKNNGRFRIARQELALLSGRENIEQSSVDQIVVWLSEKHGLLMIDMYDEFPVIKYSILRRYRKATRRVLEDILGVSYETDSGDEDE